MTKKAGVSPLIWCCALGRGGEGPGFGPCRGRSAEEATRGQRKLGRTAPKKLHHGRGLERVQSAATFSICIMQKGWRMAAESLLGLHFHCIPKHEMSSEGLG